MTRAHVSCLFATAEVGGSAAQEAYSRRHRVEGLVLPGVVCVTCRSKQPAIGLCQCLYGVFLCLFSVAFFHSSFVSYLCL